MNTTNNNTTVKAINRFATVRNYVIGFYIVKYEQHGSDRAKYGDRLLKRLAEKVKSAFANLPLQARRKRSSSKRCAFVSVKSIVNR